MSLLVKYLYVSSPCDFFSETGRSEPVQINLRVGRSGLGHETESTRKRNAAIAQQKAAAVKRQKMTEQNQNIFLAKQSEKFFQRLANKDLYKSQRVCEQLDSQKVNKQSAFPPFCRYCLVPQESL